MNVQNELERLYEVEYGNRIELAFRFLIVLGSVVIVFFYTNQAFALFWFAGYMGLHLAYSVFLQASIHAPSLARLYVSWVGFLALCIAFVSLPVWLLSFEDLAITIPSLVAVGGFILFLLRRADESRFLVIGQFVVVALAAVGIMLSTVPQVDDMMVQVVIVVTAIAFVLYFMQTLLGTRAHRLKSERAGQILLQSQKMEAVGRIAGGVAHDFNNILTIILGNLELHSLSNSPEQRERMLESIHDAAERGQRTVRQLLAYSRQANLSPKVQDLCAIVRESGDLAKVVVPATIRMEVRCEEAPLMVRVDHNLLVTALLNLALNARDALVGVKRGKITLSCGTLDLASPHTAFDGAEIAPGRYVRVGVQDNGQGIPAELMGRVGEPFFSTKPVSEGSGLGLPMVLGFAKQSGGHVTIESRTRGAAPGTTVDILLPRLPDHEVA